jgi:hypothetical protein
MLARIRQWTMDYPAPARIGAALTSAAEQEGAGKPTRPRRHAGGSHEAGETREQRNNISIGNRTDCDWFLSANVSIVIYWAWAAHVNSKGKNTGLQKSGAPRIWGL